MPLSTILFGVVIILAIALLAVTTLLMRSMRRETRAWRDVEIIAERLRKANGKLKELDKAKTLFLSIASHDLRTPLTAIRNFISLLLDGTYGTLPAAASEGLHQIFDRTGVMIHSVNDYLNASRLEQGQMKYDLSYLNLRKVVSESVATLKPVAEKKGLSLELVIPSGIHTVPVMGDEARLDEVFINLIDNAIKYTPEGSIKVIIEGGADHTVRIIVQDTGIGMNADTKSKLFKLFSPGTYSHAINASSTGVGLYIAKKHVEGHDGRLWAESAGEGAGSRFVVELPVVRAPADEGAHQMAADL